MVKVKRSTLKPGSFFYHDNTEIVYMSLEKSSGPLVCNPFEEELYDPCICVSRLGGNLGRLYQSSMDSEVTRVVADVGDEGEVCRAERVTCFACYEKIGEIVIASNLSLLDAARGSTHGRVFFKSSGKHICVGVGEKMVELEISFRDMLPEEVAKFDEPSLVAEPDFSTHVYYQPVYVVGGGGAAVGYAEGRVYNVG